MAHPPPFGEQYAVAGASDASFTGQNSDTTSTLYDFTFREHSPSQGRWLSPDPSGLAAADTTNPQSWNRYAYVLNNPLALVDSSGLDCVYLNDDGTAPEEIDRGACSPGDGGYYIPGTIIDGTLQIDPDTGLVSAYGVTWDGVTEFSVAGAIGSNLWGAWTQTFPQVGTSSSPGDVPLSPAPNNGPTSRTSPTPKQQQCIAQVRSNAEGNGAKLEILGGLGLGNAVVGCFFTGPFIPECEGGVAGLELLYTGVNFAAEQYSIHQGIAACMQQ